MIRPAREEDFESLHPLEEDSMLTSWSIDGFRRYLGRGGLFRLLIQAGHPVAYAIFEWIPCQAELLRVAVRPEERARGLAKLLLRNCFEELRRRGVRDCFLEVREGNWPARKLYTSLGFSVAGIRRDYYRDPNEDAVVMWRELEPVKSESK